MKVSIYGTMALINVLRPMTDITEPADNGPEVYEFDPLILEQQNALRMYSALRIGTITKDTACSPDFKAFMT